MSLRPLAPRDPRSSADMRDKRTRLAICEPLLQGSTGTLRFVARL